GGFHRALLIGRAQRLVRLLGWFVYRHRGRSVRLLGVRCCSLAADAIASRHRAQIRRGASEQCRRRLPATSASTPAADAGTAQPRRAEEALELVADRAGSRASRHPAALRGPPPMARRPGPDADYPGPTPVACEESAAAFIAQDGAHVGGNRLCPVNLAPGCGGPGSP